MRGAVNDPVSYSNSFGLVGTYFGVITDISKNHDVRSLLNLYVEKNDLINASMGFRKIQNGSVKPALLGFSGLWGH